MGRIQCSPGNAPWNIPFEPDRTEKRSCSDPTRQHKPYHRPKVTMIDTHSPGETRKSDALERCVHKTFTSYSLNSLNCCACADRRPLTENYPRYTAGYGNTQAGYRWQYYCFGCIGMLSRDNLCMLETVANPTQSCSTLRKQNTAACYSDPTGWSIQCARRYPHHSGHLRHEYV